MATKSAKVKSGQVTAEQAVLVTTGRKGVFFGYTTDPLAEPIVLRRARLCVRWVGTRGFMGLAANGPNPSCRIGPPAPELMLRGEITSVTVCTDAAVEAWEKAPWG